MEMFDIMHKGLKLALQSCDQAEIYGERGDVVSVELEREEVKKVKHVKSTGIGVRVVIASKIGFAHTTALETVELEECVLHAIKQARVSEPDADFAGLPAPAAEQSKRYKEPEKTFDPRIVDLLGGERGSEDAITYCKEMLAGMKEHKVRKGVECAPTEGSFAAGFDESFLVNSEGIETQDSGTYVSAGIAVVASEGRGGEEIAGYESTVSRMLDDIDFRWIGREAVKLTVESLGGTQIQTKALPVVFAPRAVQSLFAYTLIPQLSAENVQRKQSPYHGKKGETVASEMLTIVDDGTMPLGVNSRRMDGEGVPSQPTTLVEKGVLKNFLYDSYTAHKDDVESTGNALRGFDSLPTPGATNFIIKGSTEGRNTSKDEIIGELRDGLFVNDVIGAHTASRASGDFSVVAQNAFGIKNGDLFPVKRAMIVGNMQEVVKAVAMLGDDPRQIYNLVSPTLMVAGMYVIA